VETVRARAFSAILVPIEDDQYIVVDGWDGKQAMSGVGGLWRQSREIEKCQHRRALLETGE
jgi:hypothetical protein